MRMNLSSCLDWSPPSAAVGSSMITIWVPDLISRAAAII
jgi:hypothetical protein